MNRTDLVNEVAARLDLHPETVSLVTLELCNSIATALASGEAVALRGFGEFSCHPYKAQRVRGFDGEYYDTPPTKRISFRPGATLKAQVDS